MVVERLPGATLVRLDQFAVEVPLYGSDGRIVEVEHEPVDVVCPSRFRWSNDERPSLSAEFEIYEGRIVCVGVAVRGDATHPVPFDALRGRDLEGEGRRAIAELAVALRFARDTDEARAADPDLPEGEQGEVEAFFTQVPAGPLPPRRARRAANQVRGRRGRPKVSDEELEELVQLYEKYAPHGRPVKDIAEQFELVGRAMPERTIQYRLKQARERGLLGAEGER